MALGIHRIVFQLISVLIIQNHPATLYVVVHVPSPRTATDSVYPSWPFKPCFCWNPEMTFASDLC